MPVEAHTANPRNQLLDIRPRYAQRLQQLRLVRQAALRTPERPSQATERRVPLDARKQLRRSLQDPKLVLMRHTPCV